MGGKQDKGTVTEVKKSTDENTIRGNWSHKMDFLLSMVGYNVGLGNIWRFPYLCFRNGGGAFLIPYFAMLAIAGLPLFFLELCVAQFVSLGPIGVWGMSPPFKGLGFAAVTVAGIVNLYYNTLMAYILFYLFASMTSQLPWTTCDHDWNTPACTVRTPAPDNMTEVNTTSVDRFITAGPTVSAETDFTALVDTINNTSRADYVTLPKSPAEEYFERYVLDLSSGIDDIGSVRWQLALCLLLSWILIFLCLIKGIKSAGKVVYFTAIFPYVILVILLVRGLTLPGSFDGIKFYLVPQWKKLLNMSVWGDAATQIFYSLGPAWGGLLAFASYNKFHANCQRDALFSSFMCCGTSVFAGCVIFSVIGYMAHELNVPIEDVMTSGPGLAFVVYPEAIARMPVAPFWAIIFFAMLLSVGLDSMFATVEIVVVAVMDELPARLQKRRMLFTLGICVVYFLVGLSQVTQGGMYVLNLIDWYIARFSVFIIAILEIIVIIYIYGHRNVFHNIKVMLGFEPNIFFRACWFFFTPAAMFLISLSNAIQFTPARYGLYTYPVWTRAIGWMLSFLPLMWIPGYMIYYYGTHIRSLSGLTCARLCALMRAPPQYGPMMPQHRLAAGFELIKDSGQKLEGEQPERIDDTALPLKQYMPV